MQGFIERVTLIPTVPTSIACNHEREITWLCEWMGEWACNTACPDSNPFFNPLWDSTAEVDGSAPKIFPTEFSACPSYLTWRLPFQRWRGLTVHLMRYPTEWLDALQLEICNFSSWLAGDVSGDMIAIRTNTSVSPKRVAERTTPFLLKCVVLAPSLGLLMDTPHTLGVYHGPAQL